MSDLKTQTIDAIIAVEGGYVDDPDDSGGETNYGITVATARGYGYQGDMIDLPRSIAFDIYAEIYWDSLRGDDLANVSEAVAAEVVDTGVNCGTPAAGKFLQRALNVLNDREALYADIEVDGHVGGKTVAALQAYVHARSERAMMKALNCLQGAFYIELAERREKDERFLYGWLTHRVEI
jgi:lysozyme family protein